MSRAKDALMVGEGTGYTAPIVRRLSDGGWRVRRLELSQACRGAEADTDQDRNDDFDPFGLVIAPPLPRSGASHALDVAGFLEDVDPILANASQTARRFATGGGRVRRIVLIGSIDAAGVAGDAVGCLVSGALCGYARSWTLELRTEGITANTILAPDPAEVPDVSSFSASVAEAAAFLLSPEAAAVSGQVLMICGGASSGSLPL